MVYNKITKQEYDDFIIYLSIFSLAFNIKCWSMDNPS